MLKGLRIGPFATTLGLAATLAGSVGAETQSDKKKDEGDDVVFDNRDMSKRKAEQRKEAQEKDPTFASDTPFADTAPDVVSLREQRWKPGFGGGYRLGWAFPMGQIAKGADLSQNVTGLIFLWGDVGYWPIPYLFAGLYLSGGYVLPDCSGNVSCSGWELRGGPEVLVRILPFQNITPFVGIGAGYEWFRLKASLPTAGSASISYTGFELMNAQAGLEVRSGGDFYSLFLTYSMGKFSKYGGDRSGDISDQEMHSWFGIGARGTIE